MKTCKSAPKISMFLSISLLWLISGCQNQARLTRDIQENRRQRYAILTHQKSAPQVSDWQIIKGNLSLADSLELALRHNRDVQIAKERLLESKGQLKEAISTALPNAAFSGSAMRNDNSGFNNQRETYELGVLIRQPLYLGGIIGAALDAAEVFAYQTQQQLRQAIQTVQLQVRKSYYDVLLARELVKVAQKSRENARKLLDDTQKKLEYGTATRFEVLQATVRLNAVDADLIKKQNDYRIAKTKLLDVMGVSQSSNFNLTGELRFEAVETDSSRYLEVALEKRPDLLIGEANIRLYKDNIKSAAATNLPKVYLQGTYSRNYPGFGANFSSFKLPSDPNMPFSFGGGGIQKQWDRTMSGGITVEWPFFDGFSTQGKVIKAKSQFHQQQLNLLKLEQQTQLEITQALLNLQSSEQFVNVQKGNVTNAEEAMRLSQVGYRAGTATSLDVITSETSLAQARSNYLQAVHDYKIALLSLHKALGTLGEEDLPASSKNGSGVAQPKRPDMAKNNGISQQAKTKDSSS